MTGDVVGQSSLKNCVLMHLTGENSPWKPFPPTLPVNETSDRNDANRAIGVSAIGLGAAGLIELAIAVRGGSVGRGPTPRRGCSSPASSATWVIK